jgi:catechol 2,3-dioxygenase-like lactoylglutathione lyase family enzyme
MEAAGENGNHEMRGDGPVLRAAGTAIGNVSRRGMIFHAPKTPRRCIVESAHMADAGIPPIRGVVESILYVDDLARATVFYREVLGCAAVAGDGERFQAFDAGGKGVLLLFKRGATLVPTAVPGGIIPPHDGRGPHHIAFAIDAANYEAWRARLRERGHATESETRWERGGRSLYFRDPDGHLVELVTPGIWPNY